MRVPAISEHKDRRSSLGERGKADIAGNVSDTGGRFSTPRPVSQAKVSGSGYQRASHVPIKPQTLADKLQEKLSSILSRMFNKVRARIWEEVEGEIKHFYSIKSTTLKPPPTVWAVMRMKAGIIWGEMGLCEFKAKCCVSPVTSDLCGRRLTNARGAWKC